MIRIGDRVRVEYSGKELAEYSYAKAFQGKEYIVADDQTATTGYRNRGVVQHIYTLHGAESKHGMPFFFTADQLVKVG